MGARGTVEGAVPPPSDASATTTSADLKTMLRWHCSRRRWAEGRACNGEPSTASLQGMQP
jgi:hypothetical protein